MLRLVGQLARCQPYSLPSLLRALSSIGYRLATGKWPSGRLDPVAVRFWGASLVGPRDSLIDLCLLDEPRTASLVVELAERGLVETAVDAGAFIGTYTVLLAVRGVIVRAVEPNPYARVFLRANIRLNRVEDRVVVDPSAICSRGAVQLCISSLHMGQSSLDERRAGGCLARVTVECSPLLGDDEEVDLVKLDVEGSEDEALETLPQRPRTEYFIIETSIESMARIASKMGSRGYKCRIIEELIGGKGLVNLLCVKRGLASRYGEHRL